MPSPEQTQSPFGQLFVVLYWYLLLISLISCFSLRFVLILHVERL